MELLALLGKMIAGADVLPLMDRTVEKPIGYVLEDTSFLEFRELGVCLSAKAEDGRVCTVHLFCEPAQGYSGFAGNLPAALRHDFSRVSVRNLLGPPSLSGELGCSALLGPTNAWDRYDFQNYSLHVQYTLDETAISLVTLMTASRAPGRR